MSDDTKRLDWLNKHSGLCEWTCEGWYVTATANESFGPTLRDAIDAAMAYAALDPMNQPVIDDPDAPTLAEAIERADDMRHERKERGE
jgi:hypothetical protein